MANQIRLQHRAPSLRTYVIPVEHGGGEAHLLGRVTRDPKSGTAGVRVVTAVLPTSITLCAKDTDGDTSELLDESVLRAPQIAAALAAKTIVVLTPAPVAPPAVAEPEPSATAAGVYNALPASLTSPPKPIPTTSKKPGSKPDQE